MTTESQLDLIVSPFVEMVDLDYDYYGGTFYIYNFKVPKTHRNKGWGTKILSIIVKAAEQHGLNSVTAHIALTTADPTVERASDPTVRLLQSVGFHIVGIDNTVEGKYVID